MPHLTRTTALIVVDLQTGIASSQHAHPTEHVVRNVDALAAATRGVGGRVAFVRHDPAETPRGLTSSEPRWTRSTVAYGNLLAARALADWNITRGGWSAFAGTDLDRELEAADIRTVVIVGQATSGAVESTARAAHDLGYAVLVIEDATNDPDPQVHADRFENVFGQFAICAVTADFLTSTGPGATAVPIAGRDALPLLRRRTG